MTIIELQDVSVHYGKRVALERVSASMSGGAIGLLGPNGAGKSTLLKALLGLVPISSGSVAVLGEAPHRQLRRRIGYMPEREAAFPGLTGFQATWYAGRLAGMPDADARRRAHEVLLFAGLGEERYRKVDEYSTGMRQRVKLAQALVHDPDLIFLDEPTNGLDPKGRVEMLALISLISSEKGIHVVLSSHLLRDVEEVCESVVVMQGGRIVREERIDELARATRDAYVVDTSAELDAFAQACGRRGLETDIDVKRKQVRVKLTSGPDTGPIFAAAAEADAVVRSLRPVRVSLEEALEDVLAAGVETH